MRKKPDHMEKAYMTIPQDFIKLQKFIIFPADVMFVNDTPIVLPHNQEINLTTIEFTTTRTEKHLSWHIIHDLSLYSYTRFLVRTLIMDMEFEKVKDEMPSCIINTIAAKEHVAEIVRQIKIIKEWAWRTLDTLPFK